MSERTRGSGAGGNLALRAGLVLFVAVMFSIHVMGGLLAKYASTDSGGDGARMASFAFDLADSGDSHVVGLEGVRKPGDSEAYTFSVRNGGETSLRYRLSVEVDGSMPIAVSIATADQPVKSVVGTTARDLAKALDVQHSSQKPLVSQSAWLGPVAPNSSEVAVYKLTATWPEREKNEDASYTSYTDAAYAGGTVCELTVSALAEQVD